MSFSHIARRLLAEALESVFAQEFTGYGYMFGFPPWMIASVALRQFRR